MSLPRPEVCTLCDQEVRYGVRHGKQGWWHREDVDHYARFGTPAPPLAEILERRERWEADQREEPDDAKEEIPAVIEQPAIKIELEDDRMPGGAKTILKLAEKQEWRVLATYSRGPWMHTVTWTPTAISDYVLVRMQRGSEHAVGIWRDQKFKRGWTWRDGTASLEQVNSDNLKARLKMDREREGVA